MAKLKLHHAKHVHHAAAKAGMAHAVIMDAIAEHADAHEAATQDKRSKVAIDDAVQRGIDKATGQV